MIIIPCASNNNGAIVRANKDDFFRMAMTNYYTREEDIDGFVETLKVLLNC